MTRSRAVVEEAVPQRMYRLLRARCLFRRQENLNTKHKEAAMIGESIPKLLQIAGEAEEEGRRGGVM